MTAEGKEQTNLFLPGRTELAYLVVGGKSFLVMSQEKALAALRQWLPETRLTGDIWVDSNMVKMMWEFGNVLCLSRKVSGGPVVIEVDHNAAGEEENGPRGEVRRRLEIDKISPGQLFAMVSGVAEQIDSRTTGPMAPVCAESLATTRNALLATAQRLQNDLAQEFTVIEGRPRKITDVAWG